MSRLWRGLRTVIQTPTVSFVNSHHYHTIQAIPRECTGSRVSSRDRAQGRIPAVVFSQAVLEKNPTNRSSSRKQLLTTERKQIKTILKSVELPFFCSTTFQLQIRAGSGSSALLESGKVLPIKVHRDEESGKILNLVFVWADEGTELKVDVPVVFKGEENCPGLKKGGRLNRIRTTLKYLCPAEHIPPKIVVDLSKLDIDDKVFMHDLDVHPSLKLLSKNESMPICKIVATNIENQDPMKTLPLQKMSAVHGRLAIEYPADIISSKNHGIFKLSTSSISLQRLRGGDWEVGLGITLKYVEF